MSQINHSAAVPDLFQATNRLFWQLYDAWEDATLRTVNVVLRSQSLLDLTGQTIQQSLYWKHVWDRSLEAMMASTQLATRSELEQALRQLHEIEHLLRQTNEQVDRLLRQPPSE